MVIVNHKPYLSACANSQLDLLAKTIPKGVLLLPVRPSCLPIM